MSQDREDWGHVEFLREQLEEEMADVTLVIRRASAKGLSVKTMADAMVEAEAIVGDQGRRQVIVLPPAMTSGTQVPASTHRREDEGTVGEFTPVFQDAPPSQDTEERGIRQEVEGATPPPPPPMPVEVLTPNVVVRPGRDQRTPSPPHSGGSGSRHSIESRLLDHEFEQAREEAEIAVAETASIRAAAAEKEIRARATFNRKRRDIQRRQEALDDALSQRLSSGSGHSVRQIRINDVPTHLCTNEVNTIQTATPQINVRPVTPPRRPVTPHNQQVTPPRPRVAPPRRLATPPRPIVVSPGLPRRVITPPRPLGSPPRFVMMPPRRPVEIPQPNEHEITPGPSQVIGRNLPGPISRSEVPINDNYTDHWARDAAYRREERAEFMDMAAAALTTAISRNSTANPSTSLSTTVNNQSLLELVKLLERLRPVEKFDGASKKIDFDDHMNRFERALNLPGLTAKWKLAEFQEWFSGVARVKISRFLKRDDHEEALREAIEALKEAFGEKASTADEMLADLMSGPAINKKDASAIDMFISRLEESYFLALDTERDSDFNRISLYKRILAEKLPFLTNPWGILKAKKGWKKPTFCDFLEFLALQRIIAQNMADLAIEKPESGKPVVAAKVHTTAIEVPSSPKRAISPEPLPKTASPKKTPETTLSESWVQVVKKPVKRPEVPAPKPLLPTPKPREIKQPICPLCQGAHWLPYCHQFAKLELDEKISYVRDNRRCFNCLKAGHPVEKCFQRSQCWCAGKHHIYLHDAPVASGEGGVTVSPSNIETA